MTRRISKFQRILVQIIVCIIASLILLTSCQRQYGNKDYLAYSGVDQIDIPIKGIPLRNPVWSPDGNSIAILGGFADTSTELLIYNLNNKETKQLIGTDEFDITSIDWSPNSDKLAVIGVPKNNERESGLWIFDVNGNSPEFIVGASDVSWSPIDDSLVVIKTQKDTYDVEIYNLRNQAVEAIRILEYISANVPRDLAWSNDGEDVAIVIPGAGDDGYRLDRLFRLSVDGSKFSQFSKIFEDMDWNVSSPKWFPGDKWLLALVRISGVDGTPVIFPADGSCVMSLFPQELSAESIDISPDGKQVTFDYHGAIYISTLDTTLGYPNFLENLSCQ